MNTAQHQRGGETTPEADGDGHYVVGCHGTLAPQDDEAFYDDRSDADDDLAKGALHFPSRLYGRERELDALRAICDGLTATVLKTRAASAGVAGASSGADDDTASDDDKCDDDECNPYGCSRCIFLSGYSGIGKSALAAEFVRRVKKDSSQPIIHASGKYTQQRGASAPFSALAEMLERLAACASACAEVEARASSGIHGSEIRPGTDGHRVLVSTFPVLTAIFGGRNGDDESEGPKDAPVHPSMNAIKESTLELLRVIGQAVEVPIIIFVDDWQWADGASIELLSLLLASPKLCNVMFICAYRSNEVDADHPFAGLMDTVISARTSGGSVHKIDLFSLPLDAVTRFIADSVKKDDADGIAELAEAVYTKTMGNIFFVKQAMEELVRKNVLYYDVMCFEWRWVASRLELEDCMSDDVVETVKGKIRDLPLDLQELLMVMAHVPHALGMEILVPMMNHGQFVFDESTIEALLREASDASMLVLSVESQQYVFAHDRIWQASREFATERGIKERDEMLQHIARVLLDHSTSLESEWCLYAAVDLLNSLPPDMTDRIELVRLNLRVSKLSKSHGFRAKENELLRTGLGYLETSNAPWDDYGLALELYNALIVSEHSIGAYDLARVAIGSVLENATSMDDKLLAFQHQFLCHLDESNDYKLGAEDGCKILNRYGYAIPTAITKSYMMKEELKLKVALRNRSYSCLTNLPVRDEPIFELFYHVLKCAMFSSLDDLVKILSMKSIRTALKRGMGRYFPLNITFFAVLLAKQGKIKLSMELGYVAIALAEKIREDKEIYALVQFVAFDAVLSQVLSFRTATDRMIQSHHDLKVIGGNVEVTLASMMAYGFTVFAAGLELGPLFESKSKLRQVIELDER